ncbi:MAG: hypothetical protein F9K44_12345, partial [Hyphomicrobiaceae bacterium]
MFNKSFIMLSTVLISLVAVTSFFIDARLIGTESVQTAATTPAAKLAEPAVDASLARARQLATEATKAADRALSPDPATRQEKPIVVAQANTTKKPAASEPSIANDVTSVFVEGWRRLHSTASPAPQPQQTAPKPATPPAVTPSTTETTSATAQKTDPLAPATPPVDFSELSSESLIAVTKEIASATRTSFRESWRRMHQEPLTAAVTPEVLKDMEKRLKPEPKPAAVTPPPTSAQPKAPAKR